MSTPVPRARRGAAALLMAFSLLCGLDSTGSATSAPSSLPATRDVLEHFVRASGGRDAWLHHRSMTIHGRYQVAAKNLDVQTVSYTKDGKTLQIAMLAAGKSLSGYDGHTAWDLDSHGKVSISEGDEVKSIARDADMYYHLHVLDYFRSLDVVDVQNFNGHVCYHLKGVNNWGRLNEQYYERGTGLLIGYAFDTAWRGGNGAATAEFADYRRFGDVVMASRVVTRDGPSLSIFAITSVTFDDVDDKVFELPQAVRERLLKQ